MPDVENLKDIIKDQENRMGNILSKNIIEREYPASKITAVNGAANVVVGPRRCGKSVFAFQLVKNQKFGYANFDDERINIKAADLNKVLEAIYTLKGDVEYLLLDEIQVVDGWERFVSRIVDSKKVIITGSNSKLLSKDLGTYMTGRHIDHKLLPFSFREFLLYNGFKLNESKAYSTLEKTVVLKYLKDYMLVGGFPLALTLGHQYLDDLYNDIIFRDVVIKHHIKLSSKLKQLSVYTTSLSSSEVSYNKLKNVIGLAGKHTAQEWINYLEEAYLIFSVRRFSFKLKERINYPFKVYSIDTGFLSTAAVDGSISRKIENIVAIDLIRRRNYGFDNFNLSYWRNNQQMEVDFVLNSSNKVKELIQVTYVSNAGEINERETKSLIIASEELHCNNLLVITWDYEAEEKIKGKKIKFVPLWKWLLNV